MRNRRFWVAGAAVLALAGCKRERNDMMPGQAADEKSRQEAANREQEQPGMGRTATPQGDLAGSQAAVTATIVGNVVQARPDTLTVKGENQPLLQLRVDPATVVMIEGQQTNAGDVVIGSEIRASYRMVGNDATAVRIDVQKNPKPPADAAAEPPK